MIDIQALSRSGLSNESLKRIFTTKAPEPMANVRGRGKKRDAQADEDIGPIMSASGDPQGTIYRLEALPEKPTDWQVKCYLTTLVMGQSQEGLVRCAQKFDQFGAMDIAYCSIPIHPLVPDLMKVAQGYMSIDACKASVAKLSDEWQKKLFSKDAKGEITRVNTPKLLEVSHNLVNSLVTRRVAALATEIAQQYPVLKYEAFSNNQTERLRADVMTQLAEQMAGAYLYREDYEQSIRQASLYTSSFKFKSKHWHRERQTLPDYPAANGATGVGLEAKPEYKRVIVREGVEWVIPHPSRVYYDISRPLSKLNADLGPRWIGYWDAVPIGDIRDNPAYWNKDAITMDANMFSVYAQNPAYFAQYYGTSGMCFPEALAAAQTMTPPVGVPGSGAAISLTNSRTANIGTWANLVRNTATILTEHYMQVIPKLVGLGSYEDPVWIRFVLAAGTTIVYAEIVGSAPASINSYNASDDYLISPSFGMQALQWQQMLTNSLNQLVHVQAQGLVRIWALNKHGMKKKDVETVTAALTNPDFTYLKDIVIEYDAALLQERGQDINTIREKITQVKVDTAAKTNEIFNDIMNTLALAERLMFFSPQELGQVAARTTTATEQRAIRDTTLGIRDFHLVGVKRQMDADKRIIHDSYMAFGSDELEVPVAERYDPEVIEAAGFEIVEDATKVQDGLYTIRGKKLGLLYNYTYTTRNTDDTPPETAVIQGIAQAYEIASKDPVLSENLSLDQRLDMYNAILHRLAPEIPKLRLPPGADGSKTQAGAVEQVQQQMQQALPQIIQALQQLQQKQAEQDQKIEQTQAGQAALAKALTDLTNATKQLAAAGAASNRATRRGQVSPETPVGAGAPPLRGVVQAQPVPLVA